MATLALWLWLVLGVVTLGLRVALHLRRTGETGMRGVSGRPGSIEWLAGVGFFGAIVVGVSAPLLALSDSVNPIGAIDTTFVHVLGVALYAGGLLAVVVAQGAMGQSWRVGVDPSDRTTLVMEGPFSIVRNPIFTGMATAVLGLGLMVPSVVSLISIAMLLLSLEVQTRVVEEPYLLRAHGRTYSAYASRVGRFLPGLGRLRSEKPSAG